MTEAPFLPVEALRVLSSAGVKFVVIGGLAARVHGSPSITRDIDVCYDRSEKNLARLATVLRRLDATLRNTPKDVPFLLDAVTLAAGGNFSFDTDVGNLDILAVPSGTSGYDDLITDATSVDVGGVEVFVVSLDDLMRMKRAAGRAKDRVELEILSALKDEIEGRSSS